MKQIYVMHIVNALEKAKKHLKLQWQDKGYVEAKHLIVDDLLPVSLAEDLAHNFPTADKMRLMNSFREKKRTSKEFDQFNPLYKDMTYAIQDPAVLALVEEITGLKSLSADPTLYAGGLSRMERGDFLDPHIDNSHNKERSLYRAANLLYYTNKDWNEERGGNIQLWDLKVRKPKTILSQFNRLVIMETHSKSWHSVNEVKSTQDRCCISNYYFSPTPPEGKECFHVTEFISPPNKPIKRALNRLDNSLRTFVRKIHKQGLAREDVYKNPLS